MAKIISFLKRLWQSNLFKWIFGIVVVLIFITYLFIKHKNAISYQFVTVVNGPITEIVSLTGNTTPMDSVMLGFQNTGTIAHIYKNLGDKVNAGEVVAELDTASLSAALAQAKADVDVEQAKLAGLEAGSQPADIAESQAALEKAQQDLANMYSSIGDVSTDSYAKTNDAVRTQLSQFFSNGETSSPSLTYSTSNSQFQSDSEIERLAASTALNTWQNQLANVDQSNTSLETLLQAETSYIATVVQLLNSVSNTLDSNPNLDVSTLAAYKANVSTALNEVNTATTNLNTISQNIASQKATVAEAQAELDLKQAGSTTQDIAAQQAQVEQAEAGVASAEANLQGAEIVAPISGTVTQQDAKVGQLATPGTPLVSIIGNGGFEVDAGVSETDIGKLVVGDTVSMTLDAFPNETFSGSVFYIAPAETNTGGVITYLTKISFDKADPRLKSGLTANIDIQTEHKDNVLILPQYAILQNDQGTFVETLVNNKVVQNPVTLGIEDQEGNAEIISGVTAGEQVLNIGLKS